MSRNIYIDTIESNEGIYELEDLNVYENESIYEDPDSCERVERCDVIENDSDIIENDSDVIQNDKMCSKKRARMVKTMACVLSLLLLICAGLGVYFWSASYNKHLNNNTTLGYDQNQSYVQNITISMNETSTSMKPNDNLQSFLKEIMLRYTEKVNLTEEGNTVLYDVKPITSTGDPVNNTKQRASNGTCSDDKAFIDIKSAILNKNMQLIKILLENGCSANARRLNHDPLFFYALAENRSVAITLLLEHGANVNSQSVGGNTGICVAADKGQKSYVETLLKYGASVNGKNRNDQNSPLLCARSDLSIIESLLEFGADTEVRMFKDDKTLLIWASSVNSMDLVKILVRYKADVDVKDISGQTALMFSSYIGNLEVVDLLLRSGANVNATDDKSKNALSYSTQKKHFHVSQLLIQAFSDVNMPDSKRRTPIYNAANTNNIPMARLLVENNADLNGFNNNNGHSDILVTCTKLYIPLHLAASKRYNNFLEYLIQNGANVNKPGCHKITALHHAAYTRNLVGVKMLIKAGSYVNAVDGHGETSLHYSVKVSQNIEVMKFLLNNNAQLKSNAVGVTPLHLAKKLGRNQHVLELLEEIKQ